MWCPNCKNEYVTGITTCADCGAVLVDSLEEYEASLAENTAYEKDASCCVKEADTPREENHAVSETADTPPDSSYAAHAAMPSHAYISKKAKTEDMKSTAYTFTLVGALGIAFLVLYAAGVLPIQVSAYMKIMLCIVMGILFVIFLFIGIRSFMQIKALAGAADDEEALLADAFAWFHASYDADAIDNGLDTSESEEVIYFARYEVMRQLLLSHYPAMEESLLDHAIETLYAELFG